MIKEIKGNILDTHCKLIAHGVNCQGVMGSGVAKALYEKYPIVKKEYLYFVNFKHKNLNPDELLGKVSFVDVTIEKTVVNCFTQQNFGTDGQIYLNFDALTTCLADVLCHAGENNIKEIAIPRIGCGLAGGDWKKVKKAIEDLQNDLEGFEGVEDITINVYYLE